VLTKRNDNLLTKRHARARESPIGEEEAAGYRFKSLSRDHLRRVHFAEMGDSCVVHPKVRAATSRCLPIVG